MGLGILKDETTIGERIKRVRRVKGLTQMKVATRLGVSNVTVHFWESGKRLPKLGTIRRIAEALRCPVSELVHL